MCQIQGLKYGYVLGIGPYETKIYARFVGCRKTKIEIEIYRFQLNKEKKRNLWVEGRKMTERWGERVGTWGWLLGLLPPGATSFSSPSSSSSSLFFFFPLLMNLVLLPPFPLFLFFFLPFPIFLFLRFLFFTLLMLLPSKMKGQMLFSAIYLPFIIVLTFGLLENL